MYPFHFASAALAETSLIHGAGVIFHPVFVVLAALLAALYGVTASYGLAIVLLTLVIMTLLLPLTLRSTRSMLALQRLQPRIRHLQQEYKGPENREQLNRELLQVYKEEGISPAGGCLTLLLQLPILLVLYDVIKGLSNTLMTVVQGHSVAVVQPRYIPTSSRLYHQLMATHGAMNWLGINLALRPFSTHATWLGVLPYLALVLIAVTLQYVLLAQTRGRSPAAAPVNPQMQKVQKFLPLLYAYIYLIVPGAVVLYIIVSTAVRIGTQFVVFRKERPEPPSPATAA